MVEEDARMQEDGGVDKNESEATNTAETKQANVKCEGVG